MGAVYRSRKRTSRVSARSVKKRGPRRIIRPLGSYGIYRGTRFAPLRRTGAIHARRVPRTLGSLYPNNGKLLRHKYCDRISLSATGVNGNFQVYVLGANSLFDPDVTGVGHQPMYYDDMAAHYNKYTVMWSTLKVVIPGGGDDRQRIWGITLCDSTTEIGPGSGFVETLEQYTHTNSTRAERRTVPQVLSKTFSARKEFKTTYKGILGDEQQAITVGNNPGAATQRYFLIWCAPLSATDQLTAITLQIEMVFSAMWRYSKPSAPS